jgi:hypothetical protein
METLQAQLDQAELDIVKANNQGNYGEIPALEQKRDALKVQIAEEAAKADQENAQMVRIQEQEVKRDSYTLSTDFNEFFSNPAYLNADGEPYVVTSANRVISQVVKDALAENDDEHNSKLAEVEAEHKKIESNLQSKLAEYAGINQDLEQVNEELRIQLSQAIIDKEDAESKRDAAMTEKKQREAQESQDLAKLIADENAEKERKAAEDRAKRTVYDVVPDHDFNPKNFTAKLASTGETVTFNWTQKNFYTVLTDEAEVSQFRLQHAEQSAVPDPTLDHAVDVPTIPAVAEVTAPDVQFPVNPGAIQEEVQVAIGNSNAPVAGAGIEEAFKRIQSLEADV